MPAQITMNAAVILHGTEVYNSPKAPAKTGCWQEERLKMRPNKGASLCIRENVGGAAISTSHFVKLGSTLIRTCQGDAKESVKL